ncbi:MAG TPA: hypothetical protein DDW50_04835 [Firmicutes bacterium]|jgi:uncharacterized protein (DUF58 family)|nr:hypothetical protein [Bacillota bacterium]
MVFTWYFIGLLFGLAVAAFLWPGWYLGYGLLALFIAWFGDRWLTLKQPRFIARREFKNPSYQNQPSEVQIFLANSSGQSISVLVKDEPPFVVKAPECQGTIKIPAHEEKNFIYSMISPLRGVFDFGDLNLRRDGRLHLFAYQVKIPLKQELKVYPDLAKLFNGALAGLTGSDAGMRRRLKQPGASGELAQLREYTHGDDYRKINWKVTAHRGKPFINEFEPEKDQNVYLILDTGRMLFDPITSNTSRLDHILDSAILLAFNIQEYGDRVGALSFHSRIERFLPVGKGKSHLQKLINQLFDVQAVMVESDYRSAFNFFQGQVNKRSLIFVYTDLLDNESSKELISYLQIISRHHLVICVLSRQNSLESLLEIPITDEQSAYLKGTVLELEKERGLMVKSLNNYGIKVLEVNPSNIRQSVIEHYNYLKRQDLF